MINSNFNGTENANTVNNDNNNMMIPENMEILNSNNNSINTNNKLEKDMQNSVNISDFISALSTSNEDFSINVDTVKAIKKNLLTYSSAVEIIIKSLDNMLGLKISILNPEQKEAVIYELGADRELIYSVICAVIGRTDKLNSYLTIGHKIEKGTELKVDILKQMLDTALLVEANIRATNDGSNFIEVSFQLGYRRKLKIYFTGQDEVVIKILKSKGLLTD